MLNIDSVKINTSLLMVREYKPLLTFNSYHLTFNKNQHTVDFQWPIIFLQLKWAAGSWMHHLSTFFSDFLPLLVSARNFLVSFKLSHTGRPLCQLCVNVTTSCLSIAFQSDVIETCAVPNLMWRTPVDFLFRLSPLLVSAWNFLVRFKLSHTGRPLC